MALKTITLPAMGDFKSVEVIEVLVAVGDAISLDQPLLTLESDKASMDVPSTFVGVVKTLQVKVGDKISAGAALLTVETAVEETADAGADTAAASPAPVPAPASADIPVETAPLQTDVVVIGAGPGGYTAAFRAADLGLKVILVERYPDLGGVCLNVGCIPSKALLHLAQVITETQHAEQCGLHWQAPTIELEQMRAWKTAVVKRLTGGLSGLAKKRKVQVVQGVAQFVTPQRLQVETPTGQMQIGFKQAIIAVGSEVTKIPGIPYDDPRIMDSTGALALADIPKSLLVIGGGIIGLEMATVYQALGTQITVVELLDGLIPGCDPDLVKPLHQRIAKRYQAIYLKTKVTRIEAEAAGLAVYFEGETAPAKQVFDRVLVAVGRRPNGAKVGAVNAGVEVDARGFIRVDKQQRTNVPHIFAIGDVVGQPMLAHKAVHEGKVAAEVCAGLNSAFDAQVIPAVAYTDPEVAWVGITETEAKAAHRDYGKGVFPWAASGRALSLGREDGFTKILFDAQTHRVIGMGIVGPHAGDLIAEGALAIEMGCDAEDIGLTIHPHPTLSETVAMAAEAFAGTLTDLYLPRSKP